MISLRQDHRPELESDPNCSICLLHLLANYLLRSAARDIYLKRSFKLVKSKPHCSYGQDLVGETSELML